MILVIPWTGWVPVAIFALAPVPLLAIDRYLATAERPERIVAGTLALLTTQILAGIAVTGGVHSPLLPWIVIPVVTAAARFRWPVFLTGSATVAAALVLAVVLGSSDALLSDPAPVIATIVLLAALVAAQQPLLDAEIRWRRDAVLDPLRDWIAKGRLPALQLDPAFRVRHEDLEAMIAARTTQAQIPEASPWDDVTVSTTQGVKRP